MRNFKYTIIAGICFILSLVAVWAVWQFWPEETTSESAPQAETKVKLYSFKSDEVVKIESKYEEFFSLYYADEKWNIQSHTDVTVYDTAVETFIRNFANLSGNIIKDFDDVTDFGITKDSYYTTVELKDGTSFTVRYGIEDTNNTAMYVTVDGVENTVYSVNLSSALNTLLTRNLLIKLEAFSFSTDFHPSYFSMSKDGKAVMSAKATFKAAETESEKDITTWQIVKPIEIAANNENFNNLVKSLDRVPLSKLYESNCEDLSKYGFDKPTIEYVIEYTDGLGNVETESIKLGAKTEDASEYYCIINGDNRSVYTVDDSYIMIDITIEDYIDGNIFYEMYDTLSDITFTFGSESHTMKFVFGEDDKEERFFDGQFVHDEDAYRDENLDTPEDKFNHLLASLYTMQITTVDPVEPAEKGELLLTVTYNRLDGTSVKIDCYKRDDTTAYLYKDGEYFGGYMKTAFILYGDYLDYGVEGSLEALKKAMK